jgi:hypothetical protein
MAELWRAKKSEQPRFTGTVAACWTGRVLAAHHIVKIRKNIGIMEK